MCVYTGMYKNDTDMYTDRVTDCQSYRYGLTCMLFINMKYYIFTLDYQKIS